MQGIPDIVRQLHELFRRKGLTLSTAESCTGGLISHYLTSLPGASSFFSAGIICYSADAKRTFLGVSDDTLNRFGLVSEETAREMAEKVRAISRTDYAVAVTGNLGPDVLEGKQRGLIYGAACKSGITISRELRLTGNRAENREAAALAVLGLLHELAGDGITAG